MRKNILSINHIWLMVFGAFAPVMSAFGQTSEDTLSVNDFQIQEVVVSAPVRQAIVSREEVKYQELNHDNTGQNLPILLSKTPSLVTTSDDGLGVGYTYFRVRGSDHTRVNMTINEVPLNDAESQSVFWVNMTDISSSITKLDVQRGAPLTTRFLRTMSTCRYTRSWALTEVCTTPSARWRRSMDGGVTRTVRKAHGISAAGSVR